MSFSVTGGTPALGSVVGDASCITDWITILCATNTMNPAAQSGIKTKQTFHTYPVLWQSWLVL